VHRFVNRLAPVKQLRSTDSNPCYGDDNNTATRSELEIWYTYSSTHASLPTGFEKLPSVQSSLPLSPLQSNASNSESKASSRTNCSQTSSKSAIFYTRTDRLLLFFDAWKIWMNILLASVTKSLNMQNHVIRLISLLRVTLLRRVWSSSRSYREDTVEPPFVRLLMHKWWLTRSLLLHAQYSMLFHIHPEGKIWPKGPPYSNLMRGYLTDKRPWPNARIHLASLVATITTNLHRAVGRITIRLFQDLVNGVHSDLLSHLKIHVQSHGVLMDTDIFKKFLFIPFDDRMPQNSIQEFARVNPH